MKEKLLEIITHYGINPQQKQLQEEVFELQEAISAHEYNLSGEYEIPLSNLIGSMAHIEEEYADVMVMLEQFKALYDLDNDRIIKIMNQKIDRQLERIANEQKGSN